MPKKLKLEDFKKRIDEIFDKKIDVSEFIYVNSSTKGLCKCQICGNIWYAVPNSLLNGHGCRLCYNKKNSENRKISFEEIKRILETNGSNVEIVGEYIDTKHLCRIKCKICGREWDTRIGQYLKGGGCPICKNNRMDNTLFIEKLKHIYGDKYDYSKVNYINNKVKIILICKKHGEFKILPSTALNNNNGKCKLCKKEEVKRKNKEIERIKKEKINKKEKTKKEKIKNKSNVNLNRNKITQKEFIEKCKKIYSNEPYDFSKTVFVNYKTKVKITCLEHGDFEKSPSSVLKGLKCPLCARTGHKYTTEEWVRLAKIKYPQYDYSKVDYKNKETPITIICNEKDKNGNKHGEMRVYPNAFLRNGGKCIKCEKEKNRIKKEKEYIIKANKVHGNKYDYSSVYYEGAHTKIKIKCPNHGFFEQNPTNHLNGCKCPYCANEQLKEINEEKKNIFQKIFIERSKEIHNNKYDYEKVVYRGNEIKVTINCPIHGDFEQTPHSHLIGQGCPKCGVIKGGLSGRLTQEEFLLRINDIHRYNKYDFSKVVYDGCDKKVTVICSKHGEFKLKAQALLRGCGCPICKMPKLEKEIRNVLIENNIKYVHQKRFKGWLGKQSLDFYLPEYNIAIECQGMQHFKNERRYQDLEGVQERDKKKKKLCKENNVHLIYYVPEIFAEFMDKDDICFTDVNNLIDYIKSCK